MFKLSKHLKQEHEVIEHRLNILKKVLSLLRLGKLPSEEAWKNLMHFFKNYADAMHHENEEKFLIPALVAKGFPYKGGPECVYFKALQMMNAPLEMQIREVEDLLGENHDPITVDTSMPILVEHILGRKLISLMNHLFQKSLSNSSQIVELSKWVYRYILFLEEHIDKENRCLFPMADDTLSETEQNQILVQLKQSLPSLTRYQIAYPIRDSLYLNITSRCILACRFCPKHEGDWVVKGYNLKLEKEPSEEEVIAAMGDVSLYSEVVFCGLGEATLRLDLLISIAKYLKEKTAKVRLNTSGLANLFYGRNILPELKGLIDSISISLNAANAADYVTHCPSRYGEEAYPALLDFIKEAKKAIPEVQVSAVALPGLEMQSIYQKAEELGVKFKEREHDQLG